MYISDLTHTRAVDGSGNLIGYVSVTVDQRRHLSALEIQRGLDGTSCLGITRGNTTERLRAVHTCERRLFQAQLFAELRKRVVDLSPPRDATAGSPLKSDAVARHQDEAQVGGDQADVEVSP